MTTEQLAALKEVAKLAAEKISHPKGCDCVAQFNRRFTPTTCLELIEEVERLRLRIEEQICSCCAASLLDDPPHDPVCVCGHFKYQHIQYGEGEDYEDCAEECPCLKFQEQL